MVNSGPWNVLWTGNVRHDTVSHASEYHRINHFPGTMQIGRKDLLWRNISRMMRKHGKEFNICPLTYIFPEDYKKFQSDREAESKKILYILKPASSSCGKGIRVISKKTQVPKRSGYIVSKYIHRPHLINGIKYDLRLYVLITSYDPLTIYLYDECLVRFATEKYSTSAKSLKKRYVHLTNYSVNKKADNYKQSKNGNVLSPTKAEDNEGEESEDEENPMDDGSSKWSLKQLESVDFDWKSVKIKIKDLIVKSILSIESHIYMNMSRANKSRDVCFEVYGFDVLID